MSAWGNTTVLDVTTLQEISEPSWRLWSTWVEVMGTQLDMWWQHHLGKKRWRGSWKLFLNEAQSNLQVCSFLPIFPTILSPSSLGLRSSILGARLMHIPLALHVLFSLMECPSWPCPVECLFIPQTQCHHLSSEVSLTSKLTFPSFVLLQPFIPSFVTAIITLWYNNVLTGFHHQAVSLSKWTVSSSSEPGVVQTHSRCTCFLSE